MKNSRYVYDGTAGYGKIVEDIYVETVASESIADTLGLQAGDRLAYVAIDGTVYALNRYFDISDCLLWATEGSSVILTYERDGETAVTAKYTLEEGDLFIVA